MRVSQLCFSLSQTTSVLPHGGTERLGVCVTCVKLSYRDSVVVDDDCLAELYSRLGCADADQRVIDAIETLTRILAGLESDDAESPDQPSAQDLCELTARAAEVGLHEIGLIADGLCDTALRGDRTASAALSARLLRVGNRSLTEFWQSGAVSP